VAFADGYCVFICQSTDGEIIARIDIPNSGDEPTVHTRAIKFSPNSRLIAISAERDSVILYDADTQKLVGTFQGHRKTVSAIAFNADSSWLISGGFDGQIIVRDLEMQAERKRLQHTTSDQDGTIVQIATTPEVPFYAVGFMSGAIGIYNAEFEEPMMKFIAHQQILMGVSVSPFDDTVVTVSQDQTAKVWLMRASASCKHTLEGHTAFVMSVGMSPTKPIMITGSRDQSIRMWQYKTGKVICAISAHQNTIFQIDHHPAQNSFVSCSGDGVVCVWDYDEIQ
jgi:WD40 repeat protein